MPVIDFSNYVTKASSKKSSRGGDFNETSVRINNTSGWCDRFITIDEDIMWLYGIVVAEGSKKSITLNSNENDIAERAIKIYKKVFNRDSNVFRKLNSQAIEFKSASIYRTFFFDALNINHGARNKSINYLFKINNIKLIRAALYGLFQGDGAFRVRENKGKKYFNLTYKTTSKKLAYEIVFLIKKHFDVSASLYYGISSEREIEGRTLKSSDYYKIDIYNKEDLSNIFPELYVDNKEFNLIGTYKYSNNGKSTNINVDKITPLYEEDLYDITLEDSSSHIFPINGYILTHNCGGGNTLSHPDLIPFLVALKNHGLVANMTINQKHIKPYAKLIERLINEKLIVGVGISYSQSRYLIDIAPLFKLTDNIVFHVIMGVNNVNELSELNTFCKENNSKCKVLVLGYKQYGFGINYYVKNKTIEDNKYEWYTQIAKYFKDENITVSFDNKAIEQLKLRRFFTNEAWDRFFQSEDFVLSMYIDAVNQEYAPSSTSSNRVSFADSSLLDYFQKNRNR